MLIVFIILFLTSLLFPFSVFAAIDCPNPEAFSSDAPSINSYQFSYPSIAKSSDNNSWLMVTGGIVSNMPASLIQSAPNGESHIRFPAAQEELWISKSSNLDIWGTPKFSFNIMPETTVSFKQNTEYYAVYPSGFKSGCVDLGGNCNVQINDATLVRFNNSLYMYFSILENYRWFDETISLNDTANRNRHSIGLAVSNDDGQSWAFVDKVISEYETDEEGNLILGAWSPSAVATSDNNIDIFFNDAYGTKQYVAHMNMGVEKTSIQRLNKNDDTYRVNLDVVKNGSLYEVVYNDSLFNISRTYFNNNNDFGKVCPATIIVPSDLSSLWATPHQVIDNGKVHLFFWKTQDPSIIYHWTRANKITVFNAADLEPDGDVDNFDFNILSSNFGLTGVSGWLTSDIIKDGMVNIFDFNKLITNFGQ